MEKKNFEYYSNNLVKKLEDLFKQTPHLSAETRQTLVNIAPWLALIFGILNIMLGLGATGFSPLGFFGGSGGFGSMILIGLFCIASGIIMLAAYPKLVKHYYRGWELMFWGELVSVVYALFSGSLMMLIGVAVSLYLLFEVKGYYK